MCVSCQALAEVDSQELLLIAVWGALNEAEGDYLGKTLGLFSRTSHQRSPLGASVPGCPKQGGFSCECADDFSPFPARPCHLTGTSLGAQEWPGRWDELLGLVLDWPELHKRELVA